MRGAVDSHQSWDNHPIKVARYGIRVNRTTFVTIAMPCLNEEEHIEGCLRSVLAQDYPADRMEILVADGRSSDATRAIVARMAAEDPRVRMVDNPGRLQAAGMNEAIRRARGDIIVRMDVHCLYASDYVRKCVEVLERTGADNVGGAAVQRGVPVTTAFQRALCAALRSPLGVGGAKYRSEDQEGYVDTVPFGAFRKSVFEKIGLYDPRATTNEDAELNQRIIAAGGRVYLSREIVLHYSPRDSVGKLARQYFRYGKGRARTLLKHRKLVTIRPFIPFIGVLTGAGLVATSMSHPFASVAAAVYALFTGAEAIRVGRDAGWSAVPVVWTIFPVLHVSHGLGVAAGLFHYVRKPDWREPEQLAPATPQAGRDQAA
jgi:succinoglycan biosynthesis protein ExoA